MQAVKRREDAFAAVALPIALSEEDARWTRRSRLLFIVTAAALCWLLPGAAIYLLVAPH